MRNVFLQWAVGALILTSAAVVRAEEAGAGARKPHVEPDSEATATLPPIAKGATTPTRALPLPSGPPSRLELLVRNLKTLRLDPAPALRIAQSLERAPRMNKRQFTELLGITNRLFDNRITPQQLDELTQLFAEESAQSRDQAGISFASALRVSNVEAPQNPNALAAKPNPTGTPGAEVPNANPLGDGVFSGTRSSALGGAGNPGSLDQLVEQFAKKQNAQLERLMKEQLAQTQKVFETLTAKDGAGAQNPAAGGGLPGAGNAKGLLDGLLADLRKGSKGEEGGGERRGGRGDDEDRGPRKGGEDHSDDRRRDESKGRDGALSKLREERDRDRSKNNTRNAAPNKESKGESDSNKENNNKKDENKKDGPSFGSSSKKDSAGPETKREPKDYSSLLDAQKKLLNPEPTEAPATKARALPNPGPGSPLDSAIPRASSGGAGIEPEGAAAAPSAALAKSNSMSGGGGGGGGGEGDPFGSIGYGEDGGGASERFSFTKLVEYSGGGGGNATGGMPSGLDGIGLDESQFATQDGKAPRGGVPQARESGQILRVGAEGGAKELRWVFDWTDGWLRKKCKSAEAMDLGVCERTVVSGPAAESARRKVTGTAEAGARM